MFRAFGWDPPEYAHIPVLLHEDGRKLSKRHGDVSVRSFRQKSVYPKALTNLLVLRSGGFHDKEDPNLTKELEDINDLCNKVRYSWTQYCVIKFILPPLCDDRYTCFSFR